MGLGWGCKMRLEHLDIPYKSICYGWQVGQVGLISRKGRSPFLYPLGSLYSEIGNKT